MAPGELFRVVGAQGAEEVVGPRGSAIEEDQEGGLEGGDCWDGGKQSVVVLADSGQVGRNILVRANGRAKNDDPLLLQGEGPVTNPNGGVLGAGSGQPGGGVPSAFQMRVLPWFSETLASCWRACCSRSYRGRVRAAGQRR